MLQRIQSVFLTLVLVFAVLFVFLPLGKFDLEGLKIALKVTGLESSANIPAEFGQSWYGYVLLILVFGIMVLTVFSIFQFKRRLYQIQLGKFNILLHVGLVVTAFFFTDQWQDNLPNLPFSYGAGIVLPLVAMILILMANRAIKKDDELVRSADRIR
ncbi:MAG: DUF4293 domain-containing protein [Bacteroidales bacterium]|nr:DUF4293 domain-containing protein [Bacteroidales bacterium]